MLTGRSPATGLRPKRGDGGTLNDQTHRHMKSPILSTGLGLLIFTFKGHADPLDTWTLRQVGTEYSLRGITFAKDKLVAVGNSSTVLTSADAVAWVPHSGGSRYLWLNGIAYGGGQFIAAGAWQDGWILSFVTS